MNYIRHLTGFYDKIQQDERLNPTHISLYLALFQFWNINHFQNPISISRNEMMRLSKISALGTYHKCIKELQNFGYIEYIPSLSLIHIQMCIRDRYYRTGSTYLDYKYFLRGTFDIKKSLDSFYFEADLDFCTSHDFKVAKILANDLIQAVSYTHLDVYKRQRLLQTMQQTALYRTIKKKTKMPELLSEPMEIRIPLMGFSFLRIPTCLLYTSRCV